MTMANAPQLSTYRFNIALGSAEDPRFFHVLSVGRDVQQAEKLFASRGWGKTDNRPMTSAAAVAWAALTRLGEYHADFDTFENEYLEVVPEAAAPATPTEAAPDPA